MPYVPPLASASARRPRPRFLTSRILDILRSAHEWIARARHTAATRRALGRMDDRMLADIGVDSATAKTEAQRRFWDLD